MISLDLRTILGQRNILSLSWLEIEGIPHALGTAAKDASWFTARPTVEEFDSMKGVVTKVPTSFSQTIDTLSGGNVTAGSMSFEVLDADGFITTLVNIETPSYKLSSALSKTATDVLLTSITGLNAGDYLYIGTETIKIGSVTASPTPRATGCTRGMFKSTPQAFPSLFPVGKAPWVMANRRCWFYQAFAAPLHATVSLQTLSDTNKVLRFSGLLKQFVLKDGERTAFVLSAESMDKELDRECFRSFRTFTLQGASIRDGEGEGGIAQVLGWPGAWPGYDYLTNFDVTGGLGQGSVYGNGETLLMRIDNEVFAVVMDTTTTGRPKAYLRARALFGTKPEKHEEGATVQEVVALTAGTIAPLSGSGSNDWPSSASQFLVANRLVPDDHPLSILLQVLLSTGTGANYSGTGRNYDTLPADWGMGLHHSRVDIEGIEMAALEDPALRFGGIIDQPQNFIAFARELLTFAGFYFFVEVGDRFTVRKVRPPLPDNAPYFTVGAGSIIRGSAPSWDANWRGAVRELVFKYGFDYVESKYKRITIFKLNDADIFSKGLARTVTLESKFIHPGGVGIPGSPSFRPFDVDSWLLQRADFFKLRYGKPPPVTRVRVDYSFLEVEPGDVVYLTDANMPDVGGGTRGLTNELAEVIGKEIDDDSRTVVLTLMLTGYSLGSYRYFHTSIILSGSGLGDWYYNNVSGEFWLYSPLMEANDRVIRGATGSPITMSGQQFYVANGGAMLFKADWSQWVTLEPMDGDETFWRGYYDNPGAEPWTFSDGDVVAFSSAVDYFAFAADVDTLFGSLPPHKLFPG